MCIIAVKPAKTSFPSYQTLLKCWKHNSDGAGYMFPYNNSVIIRKGFMEFGAFMNSLLEDINVVGNDIPFVMHFRITTQGGVQAPLTHPYPLSRNMDDLRLLQSKADIGVAHNGQISLTKEYGATNYNDTMKFITEYLARLIKTEDWYKDDDTVTLIKNLSGSKLCFLDKKGHLEMLGEFTEDKDDHCFYSNLSYTDGNRYAVPTTNTPTTTTKDEKYWKNIRNKFSCCKGSDKLYENDGRYRFIPKVFCPKITDNECGYCGNCLYRDICKKED